MRTSSSRRPDKDGADPAFEGRSDAATYIVRACFDWPSQAANAPRLHFTLEDIQSGQTGRFADFETLTAQLRARIFATAAAQSHTPNS